MCDNRSQLQTGLYALKTRELIFKAIIPVSNYKSPFYLLECRMLFSPDISLYIRYSKHFASHGDNQWVPGE